MRKGSILCVDDEEAVLEMEAEVLQDLGYSVMTSHDPLEALELVKQQADRIGLVITDIVMPEMTGVELAKQVHSIVPEMPILLTTGYQNVIRTELTDGARAAGMKYLLPKPFTKGELQEAIARTVQEEAANTPSSR